ncbi:hypothetical protein FHG87_006678 [Trinorchestia longiramus]|nr:hypothetical protein FHG87_006678 [Trinorchestia longiramus]
MRAKTLHAVLRQYHHTHRALHPRTTVTYFIHFLNDKVSAQHQSSLTIEPNISSPQSEVVRLMPPLQLYPVQIRHRTPPLWITGQYQQGWRSNSSLAGRRFTSPYCSVARGRSCEYNDVHVHTAQRGLQGRGGPRDGGESCGLCGDSASCTRTVGPTPSSLSRCRTACCLWYPRTKPIRSNLACTSQVSEVQVNAYHQLGRLVSESACEQKDPGSIPSADMVDVARYTAWDLGKQPNNYRSNYPTHEWAQRDLHDEFEQSGAQLVLFPSSQRDLVTTQSHGKFYYDLQRENEDAVTFTTSDGTPVNSSLLNITPEPGKTNLAPQCIATDYSGAFRMGNTWDLQGAIALCQYKQN